MRKSNQMKILNYQFEDAYNNLKNVFIANLILATLFLFYTGISEFVNNPFGMLSFISGLTVLVLYYIYNWESTTINLTIILAYVCMYIVELTIFGIPESLLDMKDGLSKGIMFEGFMMILPVVYSGLRIIIVIPLIQLFLVARKMKTLRQHELAN